MASVHGAYDTALPLVRTRAGDIEEFDVAKISQRLQGVVGDLHVDADMVVHNVMRDMLQSRAVTDTTELDARVAREAQSLNAVHPHYGLLSGRVAAMDLQRKVAPTFSAAVDAALDMGICLDEGFVAAVREHAAAYDAAVRPERDLQFDGFGMYTLQRAYLMRAKDGSIAETPQFLYMRVAVAIHKGDVPRVKELYDVLSRHQGSMATPTLFNAGLQRQQLSSCILMSTREDSIDGIYDTLSDCARYSKNAAGIGVAVSNLRARGAAIGDTSAKADGVPTFLRVFNASARAVNQGGRRPGSMAVYVEPWHPDCLDIIELRLPTGTATERARDLFYALWIPDEFMRRVAADAEWTLVCPSDMLPDEPKLDEVHGAAFDALYAKVEARLRAGGALPANRVVKAREMWMRILEVNFETGMPYILFKDHANATSNQSFLGTIRSSNLCAEIIEYTQGKADAVCNLASVSASAFVCKHVDGTVTYDYEGLHAACAVLARALDAVIDVTTYSTPGSRGTNAALRPVGLGVQGLADVFSAHGAAFGDAQSKALNKEIFATMYHAAVGESAALAQEKGAFPHFDECPMARGVLQMDMWAQLNEAEGWEPSARYDWDALRESVQRGVRNSLSIALMPTASTAIMMRNTECFAPCVSNVYIRTTNSGEYVVWNPVLTQTLEDKGLWTPAVRAYLRQNEGSIAGCPGVPRDIQRVFRTAYEVRNKPIVDLAADRARYVCQSQSMNMYLPRPDGDVSTDALITSLHRALLHAWRRGLPTGKYYLHTKSAGRTQVVSVTDATRASDAASDAASAAAPAAADGGACSLRKDGDDGECLVCSA